MAADLDMVVGMDMVVVTMVARSTMRALDRVPVEARCLALILVAVTMPAVMAVVMMVRFMISLLCVRGSAPSERVCHVTRIKCAHRNRS